MNVPGLEKLVASNNSDKEVHRDLGYLTRAVEDLTKKLESHMDKEEGDRSRAVQEFSEYRSKTDSRLSGLERKVDRIEESTGGIRMYILLITALTGFVGILLDKIDIDSLERFWGIVSTILG